MRLYRRQAGGNYWVDFWHQGERVRESTGTQDRPAAQEYADRRKADLWRQDRLGDRPAVAWDAAVLDWLAANPNLRALRDRKDHLRWASQHLTGQPLTAITRGVLVELARLKAADGVADSTVNRYLASIGAVLNHAREREWLEAVPPMPMRDEDNGRLRWATQAQAKKLLAALPPHLAAMAEFSLATGLRRENVTHLTWQQVDADRRIAAVYADQAKGKATLPVQLSDAALAVLARQRACKDRHKEWVFPFRGRAIHDTGQRAWQAACKAAGLAGFKWHDLRHTWASWHVQNGTPLAVLQELGGWKSLAMVQRYAHLAPSHLAAFAGNSGMQPVTKPGQRRSKSRAENPRKAA